MLSRALFFNDAYTLTQGLLCWILCHLFRYLTAIIFFFKRIVFLVVVVIFLVIIFFVVVVFGYSLATISLISDIILTAANFCGLAMGSCDGGGGTDIFIGFGVELRAD